MSIDIVNVSEQKESAFDSIRHFDESGREFWKARELQKLLGYAKWQRFEDAIDRAKASLLLTQSPEANDINHLPGAVSANGRTGDDYRLSRKACYLIAMNGDPRKAEIAQAQIYFTIKIREAEVLVPAISEKLEIARLENASLKIQLELQSRQDTRIALHGIATTLLLEGKSESVVEIEKPTIEVIDQRNNTRYEGQTLTQIKDFLAKKHGIKFKSAADIKRLLERLNLEHLLAQTPRSVLSDYVPTENQQAVYDALIGLDRQLLLGE